MSGAPTPQIYGSTLAEGPIDKPDDDLLLEANDGDTRATPLVRNNSPFFTYEEPPKEQTYGYYLPPEIGIQATSRDIKVRAQIRVQPKEIPVYVPTKFVMLMVQILKFQGVELLPYDTSSDLPIINQTSAIPRDE